MDGLSVIAASGMKARLESLEMLANNLANVETGGFKADRESYSLYMSDEAAADPYFDGTGTAPVIESHWTDFSQGNLRETSNPLDVALDGDGFLAIQTKTGTRYTRNGNLRLSPAGILTAQDGNAVLGTDGGQITLQAGDPIEILKDGTVQQKGRKSGQLQLAAFDRGAVNKEGVSYYAAAPNTKPKTSTAQVLQGKLEQSNTGPAESAVRLISIMRQFEMLQKAMTIGNDMNRKAIDEVAKVTA